jgi:hypothetical protein
VAELQRAAMQGHAAAGGTQIQHGV